MPSQPLSQSTISASADNTSSISPQPAPNSQPISPIASENLKFSEEELLYLLVTHTYYEAAKIAYSLLSELNTGMLVVKSTDSPDIKAAIEAYNQENNESSSLASEIGVEFNPDDFEAEDGQEIP